MIRVEQSAGPLRAFIDRILRLKEEQDTLGADIREVYAEAKATGFDKQAMGQLVTYLRKKDKDAAKLEEQSAIFDLYRNEYEQPSHAHTHEESPDPRSNRRPAGVGVDQAPVMTAQKGDCPPVAGQGGDKPNHCSVQQEQQDASASQDRSEPVSDSGATAEDFQPPAFLLKREHHVLRPYCQNPGDACGGYGRQHCRQCLIAAGEAA